MVLTNSFPFGTSLKHFWLLALAIQHAKQIVFIE